MSDVHSFVDASQAFFNRLGDVRTGPAGDRAGCSTPTNLLLRTRAWYSIIRAAYPKRARIAGARARAHTSRASGSTR